MENILKREMHGKYIEKRNVCMENILKREMHGKYFEKRNVWKIYRNEK